MSDEIRVNGNVHSWGSIILKYGDARERAKVYGMGRHHAPRGRTRGKYTVEPVTLRGPKGTVQQLRALLAQQAPDGVSYGDVEFQIVVQYTETEAQYLAAFSTAFGSKSTVHGMICAGACWLISSVSGRRYRRPVSIPIAAREASVSQEVNTADVNLGPLPGVSIRDDLGNVVHHDESVNPGLDDARACVLRTWEGIQGVYVNRPILLSPAGSDFQLLTHRRVLNIAHEVLRTYFLRRLNKPVRVDASTGFILEADALEIEAGARAAMRSALLARPKASGIQFALSRTDNLLSTKTMTGTLTYLTSKWSSFRRTVPWPTWPN